MSTVVVELYEALRKAGVDEALARGAASAVVPANALGDLATRRDLADLRLATGRDFAEFSLASKRDLAEVRSEWKRDLAELRSEWKRDLAEFRSEWKRDLAEVRLAWKSDLSETKAELIKWNVGAMAVLTAIFAAIARLA